MLITFKSKAAADILMYETHAQPILDLLHKDIKRGIITAAETGAAIASIEAAIRDAEVFSSEAKVPNSVDSSDDGDDDDHAHQQTVSLATRTYPLLEMLRAAQKAGRDVAWGI